MRLFVMFIYSLIVTLACSTLVVCILSIIYTLAGVFNPSKFVSTDVFYVYSTIMAIFAWFAIKGAISEFDNVKGNKEWTLFKQ